MLWCIVCMLKLVKLGTGLMQLPLEFQDSYISNWKRWHSPVRRRRVLIFHLWCSCHKHILCLQTSHFRRTLLVCNKWCNIFNSKCCLRNVYSPHAHGLWWVLEVPQVRLLVLPTSHEGVLIQQRHLQGEGYVASVRAVNWPAGGVHRFFHLAHPLNNYGPECTALSSKLQPRISTIPYN